MVVCSCVSTIPMAKVTWTFRNFTLNTYQECHHFEIFSCLPVELSQKFLNFFTLRHTKNKSKNLVAHLRKQGCLSLNLKTYIRQMSLFLRAMSSKRGSVIVKSPTFHHEFRAYFRPDTTLANKLSRK